jgi:(1->4)-alpha-D-glucan 1-alpha-D-glucosylmutase
MLADLKRDIQEAGGDLPALARRLVETKEDGRVKLYAVWRALQCRRDNPGLFREGAYLPVETTGARRDHLCAFVRQKEGRSAVVVVPRLLASLLPQPGALPLGRDVWEDTRLLLPGLAPGTRLRDVFTGVERAAADEAGQAVLAAADALAHFPLALLLTV